MPSPCGQKAALYAHVGPEQEGGLVLFRHTDDECRSDGQDWSTDPFTVTERDGAAYGRGTCDMKGFDALALHAMVQAKRRGRENARCRSALSYDEEVGCTGRPADDRPHGPTHGMPRASAAIIGEPSMMGMVVTGHKGGIGLRRAGCVASRWHSSLYAYRRQRDHGGRQADRLGQPDERGKRRKAPGRDRRRPSSRPGLTVHVG